MDDKEFLEKYSRPASEPNQPNLWLTDWIVKNSFGLIKSEQQAAMLLAAASLIIIIFSIVMAIRSSASPRPENIPGHAPIQR